MIASPSPSGENNIETHQSEKAKSSWEIVNGLGTLSAGIAAILSVFITYKVNTQATETSEMNIYQAKVAAAFALHEKRLQEETLVKSLQSIDNEILKIRTELSKVNAQTPDQDERIELKKDALQALNAKLPDEIRNDMQFTLDFYRGVANCVYEEICDENATKALFEDEIRDFTSMLSPSLCKLRVELNDETIAQELERFYGPTTPVCEGAKSTTQ